MVDETTIIQVHNRLRESNLRLSDLTHELDAMLREFRSRLATVKAQVADELTYRRETITLLDKAIGSCPDKNPDLGNL